MIHRAGWQGWEQMEAGARLQSMHRSYKINMGPIYQKQMEPSEQITSSSVAEASFRSQQDTQGLRRHGISTSQELEDSTMIESVIQEPLLSHHQNGVYANLSFQIPTKLY